MSKIKRIKKFARDERTLEILEVISKLGFILFLGVAAPNAAGHIIKLLGWVPDHQNKYRTKRVLKSLEKRKLVKFWFKNKKGKMELTAQGKIYFAGLKVRKIKLPTGKRWDSLWRIVTFDVPEKLKINRQRFTRALNFAGMYNMEKSIFIYPHECKEQVLKIAELYEISKYVRYIVARSVEPDLRLGSVFPYTRSKHK